MTKKAKTPAPLFMKPSPEVVEAARAVRIRTEGTLDAESFLVINPRAGAYGIADTMTEALKNCRREAGSGFRGKQSYTVVAFNCERRALTINASVDLTWRGPRNAFGMRFTWEG